MKKVYLDNAATTPIAPEVYEEMIPYLKNEFGNPSSTHSFGRQAKGTIETSRRKVAGYLNAKPSEIIFTSGGTRSEEHTSELQSRPHLVCRLLLEKKKKNMKKY